MIKRLNSILDRYQGVIILIVIFLSLVWIFAAPFLITKHGSWDFTKTGPIGDTIGGITAPAVGLLSAVLVAFSFRAQVKANRQINKQIKKSHEETNFQYLNSEFDRIKNDTRIKLSADWTTVEVFTNDYTNFIQRFREQTTMGLFGTSVVRDLIGTMRPIKRVMNENLNLLNEISTLDLSPKHKKVLKDKYFVFFEEIQDMPLNIFEDPKRYYTRVWSDGNPNDFENELAGLIDSTVLAYARIEIEYDVWLTNALQKASEKFEQMRNQ